MGKTLVTAAQTALSFKVKNLFTDQEVLLGDYLPLPATASLHTLPDPATGTYIHEFLKFCLAQGIDQVYALRRAELSALQYSRYLFAEYNIELKLPETLDLHHCPVYLPAQATAILLKDSYLFWQDQQEKLNFLVLD